MIECYHLSQMVSPVRVEQAIQRIQPILVMDSEVSGGLTVDSEEDEHVREQVKPQSSK